MDEEAERMIPRECFAQLLLGPLRAWVVSDVEVENSSPPSSMRTKT